MKLRVSQRRNKTKKTVVVVEWVNPKKNWNTIKVEIRKRADEIRTELNKRKLPMQITDYVIGSQIRNTGFRSIKIPA